MSLKFFCRIIFLISLFMINKSKCSVEEEKLIKTLFKGYNKLIRPVKNSSEHVVITMDLVLLQLINVYEKEQVMKTNVWIYLKWRDFQFDWTANDYKVGSVRVPYDRVWTPDIVLFNNADGNYEASYKPNVVLYADVDENSTNVVWIPPAIYKSSCTIDVRYFPFDEQLCEMRFGSWTFDAQQVKLRREKPMVNLEDYLPSGTWDIISVPGYETYSKETNRMELVYHFKIRRKTLFYTVNLIIPTVLISFLSIFVFYLPTDEGEKMTLCISILLALVVFLLLVSKILPPTSMVIPLISKYLIFTLMMNIVTILNTVIIINWNYRTPRTHTMPKWVRLVFINFLPKVLLMKRPEQEEKSGGKEPPAKKLAKNLSLELSAAENASLTAHNIGLNSLSNNNLNSQDTRESVVANDFGAISMNKHNKIPAQSNRLGLQSTMNNSSSYLEDLCRSDMHKTNEFKCSNSESMHSIHYRPKQQQHKNLDKLAASLNQPMTPLANRRAQFVTSNSLYIQQAANKVKLVRKKSFNELIDDEEDSGLSRSRFRTLSGNEDSQSSIKRHHHHHHSSSGRHRQHHHHHQQSSFREPREGVVYSSGTQNTPTNLTSRNSRNRRTQFKSQSHSLEYGFDENYDEDKTVEFSPEIIEAADKVTYITNHIKSENDYEEMRDDWKYVALVIDRLQLYIFFSVTVIGTAFILFDAPHIFEFVDQQDYLRKLIADNKF